MKKQTIFVISTVMSLVLGGCGDINININQTGSDDQGDIAVTDASESGSDMTGMANPWRDITDEDELNAYPRLFKAPDEAVNVKWRINDSASDNASDEEDLPDELVELDFDLENQDETLSFTARYRYGASEDEDISGLYYDWTVTDESTLANWGGGNMQVKSYRYLSDDETVDLCTWYDIEIGIAYSLSVSAVDLDGFDLRAVAESMYSEDANTEDFGYEDFLQEQAGRTEFTDFDDIISCLTEGQGYAYIKVYGCDDDILAVSPLVFEADHSSNEMSLYRMQEGRPVQISSVYGNGSAYPLRLEDGIIYAGDNHTYETFFMSEDGGLMYKDSIDDGVNSGSGEFTGFTREENVYENNDFTGGQEEFDRLIKERDSKPIIEFTPAEAEHVMDIDMEGCDTFTQIVDKLEAGKGYSNAVLDEEDVLLIANGTYDNLDGNFAAIDAEIFCYKDGIPSYLGYVEAGGTAYPLALMDGKLYAGGNHFMSKYTVTDGRLVIMETAGETFDTDGNVTYFYDSDDGGDYSNIDQEEAKKILEDLYDEYEKAKVINFDTIK